ncbi:MAG TPA: hypothetical protein VJ947_07120 [Pseudohaliea sp.]|nr:hypothetical protein [Pseudohaliea sp.]
MSFVELIALAGFSAAALAMLLVTQTKERVAWPAWLVPLTVALPLAAWGALAIQREGLFGFWSLVTGSAWGLQLWLDRLVVLAAAFFLLQNRARAAGMKSEVWVLAIIVTGGVGLLLMLARTVFLERQQARERL